MVSSYLAALIQQAPFFQQSLVGTKRKLNPRVVALKK
jgi:hypothetical protein